MNTLFNMKKTVIACLVVLGAGSVQASASEQEPGTCSLDFALTKILHAATPEFVESIRQRWRDGGSGRKARSGLHDGIQRRSIARHRQ